MTAFDVSEIVTGLMRWTACSQPERAPDEWTVFHHGCPACRIALDAATTVEPKPGAFRGWWDHREELRTRARLMGDVVR